MIQRCFSARRAGRRGRSKKNGRAHSVHANMSETDVGCHARPPTVHNEGHSPFCSGSPTVNTILSHWASFPPPLRPPFLSIPLFHFSSSIQFGAKEDEKRESEREIKSESRERQREQICAACGPAWGRACHFSFHPTRRLAGACVHKSAYCTWASAELHWVGGCRGGGGGAAPQASAPL